MKCCRIRLPLEWHRLGGPAAAEWQRFAVAVAVDGAVVTAVTRRHEPMTHESMSGELPVHRAATSV